MSHPVPAARTDRRYPGVLFHERAGLPRGRPDAWRSAHRILEHHWGKPPEYIAPTALDNAEIDGLNLEEMSTADLTALVKERRARLASGERPTPTTDATALTAVASDA